MDRKLQQCWVEGLTADHVPRGVKPIKKTTEIIYIENGKKDCRQKGIYARV